MLSRQWKYVVGMVFLCSSNALNLQAAEIERAPVEITVDTKKAVRERFMGLGHNLNLPEVDEQTARSVFAKRLKEINSQGFDRIFWGGMDEWAPTAETRNWDTSGMRQIDTLFGWLKTDGTDVYFTGDYSSRPKWAGEGIIRDPVLIRQWATAEADRIERLVATNGYTNLRYYCMTNELNPGFDKIEAHQENGKTEYVPVNMPAFEEHQRALYQELQRRQLTGKVHLLATDALGRVDVWRGSIPYAMAHMDDITGIYGVNDYAHGGQWGITRPCPPRKSPPIPE